MLKHVCIYLALTTLPLVANAPQWSIDKEEGWNQDRLIKTYYYHSELQRQWAWEMLGRVDLRDKRVLDFGSGDGKITAELSQLVHDGSILGVDISKEMVQFANLRFPTSIYPKLAFTEINTLADLFNVSVPAMTYRLVNLNVLF